MILKILLVIIGIILGLVAVASASPLKQEIRLQ